MDLNISFLLTRLVQLVMQQTSQEQERVLF